MFEVSRRDNNNNTRNPPLIHFSTRANRWFSTDYPSSIYSWSIGHILEYEFFCFGRLVSKEKKWTWGILSNFWKKFFQFSVGKKNQFKKKTLDRLH